jgi:hypothetical protein
MEKTEVPKHNENPIVVTVSSEGFGQEWFGEDFQ